MKLVNNSYCRNKWVENDREEERERDKEGFLFVKERKIL